MNLLTIEHLSKSYTSRLLFDDTSFSMEDNEKIGIIGINGTGKSTFLRIAAGIEEPDQGSVIHRRNLYVRYLPQEPTFTPGDTVLDAIIRDNEKEPTYASKEELAAAAKSMLSKLGINNLDAKVDTLSGGEKKRTALASVLLSTADLLILDEPTNHLDSTMADFLEDYLKGFRGALLMITHDRYFLDSIVDRIVELDKGKFYSYKTNYAGFLEAKAERINLAISSEQKRQNILRKELAWIRRGARARTTKQKAHIQRYEALRDQEAPTFDQETTMESVSSRLGRTTIELDNICKGFDGRTLIDDFTYYFLKNERIGFIGPNGCGKSTLMKMIVGWESPDSGTITIGQTVKIGYFSQENEGLNPNQKVIDYIRDTAEYIKTKDGYISASQMLERFLFDGVMQHGLIGKLSGGEKRRLYLCKVLMTAPNVLILDEPTNDLDIRTLTILEDYLDSFQGIVITVSHDRYFLDRIATRLFAFEGDGRLTQHEGGYTDYQNRIRQASLSENESTASKNAGKSSAGKNGNKENGSQDTVGNENAGQSGNASGSSRRRDGAPAPKKKFSYKEQRDWETIDDDIAALEADIEDLDHQIEVNAASYSKLQELMAAKAEKEAALEEKMERWMYLNELYEEINNNN